MRQSGVNAPLPSPAASLPCKIPSRIRRAFSLGCSSPRSGRNVSDTSPNANSTSPSPHHRAARQHSHTVPFLCVFAQRAKLRGASAIPTHNHIAGSQPRTFRRALRIHRLHRQRPIRRAATENPSDACFRSPLATPVPPSPAHRDTATAPLQQHTDRKIPQTIRPQLSPPSIAHRRLSR